MDTQNYTATLLVDKDPQAAFNAINNVRAWWTNDLEGDSHQLNDEFTVTFGDMHVTTQKLVEFIPAKKVTWLITDSNLSFIEDKQEWTGTKVSFELSEQGDKTQISFTHFGLVPEVECYKDCTKGWDYFINGSLYKLLAEGKGTPGLW